MTISTHQKRIAGILLLIVFGVLLILVLLGVLYAALINKDLAAAGSLAFLLFLFLFPFYFGRRLYKRSKNEALTLNALPDPEAQLTLTVNITLADYRKVLFQLAYSNLFYLYITGIGILIVGYLFIDPPTEFSFGLLIPVLILLLPVSIYFQASKSYYATKTLKEEMIFKIDLDSVKVFGQTFSSTINWESVHKVKETSKWFLLYTGNQVAYIIPKRSFKSEADVDLLRNFVISTPGLLKEFK